jgi:hypothetical protein
MPAASFPLSDQELHVLQQIKSIRMAQIQALRCSPDKTAELEQMTDALSALCIQQVVRLPVERQRRLTMHAALVLVDTQGLSKSLSEIHDLAMQVVCDDRWVNSVSVRECKRARCQFSAHLAVSSLGMQNVAIDINAAELELAQVQEDIGERLSTCPCFECTSVAVLTAFSVRALLFG